MDAPTGILSFLSKLLASIPDEIWGVLVGSLLTLLGSWFANRHARKLLKEQLGFDRQEKVRERVQQLRRDVYLPAAESITRILSTLGKALDPNYSNEALETESAAVSQAITKIQLVASDDTIRKVSEFNRALGIEVMHLIRARAELQMVQAEVNLAQHWRDRFQSDIDQMLQMMRAYNLEGVHNPTRWTAIQQQSDFATRQRAEFATKWEEASRKLLGARFALTKGYLDRVTPLMRLSAAAILAIRNELEFDNPSRALLEELDKNVELFKGESELTLSQFEAFARNSDLVRTD